VTAVEEARERRIPGPLLGMMLFIASELMFFGSLFGAYFTIRAATDPWPPAGTAEIDTLRTAFFSVFLIASSFTIQRAMTILRTDDIATFLRWLAITIGLGVVFLGGQAWEYSELIGEDFVISTSQFATLFFTMTGFHGLHVAGGLVAIAAVWASARSGRVSAARHGTAEAVSYYWHFVDVVWIFLFLTLYIVR
jgi:heme/copper-type cytochrome/quinol oxidase subunit 3